MRVRGLPVAVMFIAAARVAAAADPPTHSLDLAGGDVTAQVQVGQAFQYQIVDELPAVVRPYSITVVVEIPTAPPFQLPGASTAAPANAAQKFAASIAPPPDCGAQELQTKLEAATSEGEVKDIIALALSQATQACVPVLQPLIDRMTKENPQTLTLRSGEVATITVTRSALGSEKDAKKWTFIFTAGTRGAWLMHYGFSFLGNRDRAFSAAVIPNTQSGQTTQYRITPKTRRTNLQYLPTFTFSYVPSYIQRWGWGVAPTAGLGTDLSNVAVFLGAAGIIRDNVNIYVGVAASKQQRLNGKYHSGDTVSENLSDDQLNEKVYVPSIVFGVGFRFSSNPFSSNNSGQSTNSSAKKTGGSS